MNFMVVAGLGPQLATRTAEVAVHRGDGQARIRGGLRLGEPERLQEHDPDLCS